MNNLYESEAKKIQAAIVQVFPVEPIPKWLFTYEGSLENDVAGDVDYVGTHRVFAGKLWTDVGYEQFCAYRGGSPYDCYNFLQNAEAFRYYLPALLKLAAKPDLQDWDALMTLCDFANALNVQRDLFEERFYPLSNDQKSLIAQIMRYGISVLPPILRRDPATPAYWSYWYQFDPDPLPKSE